MLLVDLRGFAYRRYILSILK